MIKIIGWAYYIGSRIILAVKMLLSWIINQSHGFFHKNMLHKSLETDATFFPKNWPKSKIRKKLREAYKDGVAKPQKQDQAFGLLGHTREGVPIRFWFDKKTVIKTINGENVQESVFFIHSVYPLIKS
jgi:hypothetical protein